MKYLSLIGLFLILGIQAHTQVLLIPEGAAWRYLDDGSDQQSEWKMPEFNDKAWAEGPAELGYGDGDEATTVNSGPEGKYYITTYFRKRFFVHQKATFTLCSLRLRRDDGIVVYVNGIEIYRNNMPAGKIGHLTPASSNAPDDGNLWLTQTFSPSLLYEGANIIAVEIHQFDALSTDISFECALWGIGGNSICPPTTDVTLNTATKDALHISWPSKQGVTFYNIKWKEANDRAFTSIDNVRENNISLTNLEASTTYHIQIQAVCQGTKGNYSRVYLFSTKGLPAPNKVKYIWSGAITPNSAVVAAKMTLLSDSLRLRVSTSPKLTEPIYSAFYAATATNNLMVKMQVNNLQANTTYYYGVESYGYLDESPESIGKFTTPKSGPMSFRFTTASCAANSDHASYVLMQEKKPLFHMATGDLHYADPNSLNLITHRLPYEREVLSKKAAGDFFKQTAVAYTWDDHDYCGNDLGGAVAGQANARRAYQEYVPHYPLAAGSGNVPIYQAFTIGRIRFILSDLRSERGRSTMMGQTQKAWFKQQCKEARDNAQIICWVSSISFGGNKNDNWGGYPEERNELANFFRDEGISNMFIISGDAHMVAIDDGSNHDFSTGTNNPYNYPVFQAAAINARGSTKGGSYNICGTMPNPDPNTGQYGVVDVFDDGRNNISIKFTAYRTEGNTTKEQVICGYEFARTIHENKKGPQLPVFSLRAIDNGLKVKILWNNILTNDAALERSSEQGQYLPLLGNISADGSFIDSLPYNGWNLYRIVNKEGKVLRSEKIFIKGNTAIKVFPNPSDGKFTVEINALSANATARCIVYNEKMKTVSVQNINLNAGKTQHQINLTDAAAGLYYIHVVVHGVEFVEKIAIAGRK